jgi:hypothetical protein
MPRASPMKRGGELLWLLYHIVVEPHGNTGRSRDSYSFIARKGLSLSLGINQAFIRVCSESPTNVSLFSSVPRAFLPSPLQALRHTPVARGGQVCVVVEALLIAIDLPEKRTFICTSTLPPRAWLAEPVRTGEQQPKRACSQQHRLSFHNI